jgi:hypothetical protein
MMSLPSLINADCNYKYGADGQMVAMQKLNHQAAKVAKRKNEPQRHGDHRGFS